jgi:putative ABC transport system ATP-binding protein
MNMTKTVLEVRDLVKTFTVDGLPIHAVDHVNFQVHAGEFVGLVGPSGSGKTTLLAVLAALLIPTSGEVLIDGRALSKMGEKERVRLRRSRIGFTFQSNNLIPFLNAQENVDIMLRLNGYERNGGRNGTVELLSRLGLGDHLHFLPGQMSGGQQQRVAIARAMIHNPALVLADEPTAALDTERAFQVVKTFAALIHERGGGGIMVTHDLRMCRHVDRVLQMQDGRMVAEYKTASQIESFARSAG